MHKGEELVRRYKVLLLGEMSVGKTCILARWGKGWNREDLNFIRCTIPPEFINKDIDVDGTKMKLTVWDLSGQERYRKGLSRCLYRDVNGVIMLYDISKKETFDMLDNWIKESKDNDLDLSLVPTVLLGNKSDIPNPVVTKEMGQKFATEKKFKFFQTSAMLDSEKESVDYAFLTLARCMRFSKPRLQPKIRPQERKEKMTCSTRMSGGKYLTEPYKVILLGDNCVGKSSLLKRWNKGSSRDVICIQNHVTPQVSTIEISVDDTLVKMKFWDITGMERYRKPVTRCIYCNVEAIIFVYDVTDKKTLDHIDEYIHECNENDIDISKVPCVLFANKCDLPDIAVPLTAGEKFANERRMIFWQSSALLDSELENLNNFLLLLGRVLKFTKRC